MQQVSVPASIPDRLRAIPSFFSGANALSRVFLRLALVFAVAVVHLPVSATENGGFGPYAVGAQTLGSGLLPPPGVTMNYGYVLYYEAERFVDGQGRSMVPDFHLAVSAEGTMTRHTWDFQYAGMKFGSALIQEALRVGVDAGGASASDRDVILFNVQPLAVSRAFGAWHLLTVSHLLFPLGNYDTAAMVNAANNYFAFAQEWSATWIPNRHWMVDLSTNLTLNKRNKKSNYKSGDLVALTWGIHHKPFPSAPQWQVGVNGVYLRQIEDDELHDQRVGDGFRIHKASAGPQIGYWFSPAVAVVVKWQKEWDVENAPQGDAFWLQAAFPL